MLYEDVQRDPCSPSVAGNGWSSSEFESYDEQSDGETKMSARSKVETSPPHIMSIGATSVRG